MRRYHDTTIPPCRDSRQGDRGTGWRGWREVGGATVVLSLTHTHFPLTAASSPQQAGCTAPNKRSHAGWKQTLTLTIGQGDCRVAPADTHQCRSSRERVSTDRGAFRRDLFSAAPRTLVLRRGRFYEVGSCHARPSSLRWGNANDGAARNCHARGKGGLSLLGLPNCCI
jgi:hypothetical protein